MVCDEPEAYEGQDGFDFLTKLPTVWDETIVPGAEVSQWVSIARRKGNDWYVGTINNNTPKTVTVPLSFLSQGKYTAEIYRDGTDAVNNPNKLIKEMKEVNAQTKLTLELPAGGGEAIKLSPVK